MVFKKMIKKVGPVFGHQHMLLKQDKVANFDISGLLHIKTEINTHLYDHQNQHYRFNCLLYIQQLAILIP
jgi:hypothetical protein